MIGQISASNQLRTSSELAPTVFGASSQLAGVMEFGFNWFHSMLALNLTAGLDTLNTLFCAQRTQVHVRKFRENAPIFFKKKYGDPTEHLYTVYVQNVA